MAILHVVMFNLLIIQMVRIHIESVSYLCSDLVLVYLFELCNVHSYKYDGCDYLSVHSFDLFTCIIWRLFLHA